jgi:hypothetical protein
MSTNINNYASVPVGGQVVNPVTGPFRLQQIRERVQITSSNVTSVLLSSVLPTNCIAVQSAQVRSASAMGYTGNSGASGTANAYAVIVGSATNTTITSQISGTSTATTQLLIFGPISTSSNQTAANSVSGIGSGAEKNTNSTPMPMFLIPADGRATATHRFFVGTDTSSGYLFNATGNVDLIITYLAADPIPLT